MVKRPIEQKSRETEIQADSQRERETERVYVLAICLPVFGYKLPGFAYVFSIISACISAACREEIDALLCIPVDVDSSYVPSFRPGKSVRLLNVKILTSILSCRLLFNSSVRCV